MPDRQRAQRAIACVRHRAGSSRLIVTVAMIWVMLVPDVTATPASPASTSEVFVGAGDIATCWDEEDEATARLLDGIEGTVFTLGDNAYDHGSEGEFASCYDPTWGRHRERTRPVPGNHEYGTEDAWGYFDYFGPAAGTPGEGWYAFDLGAWRVIALNTNCDHVGGCGEGSPQLAWLEAELQANSAHCTLAFMHHPRFSSAGHGDDVELDAIWRVLHAAGVELALAGHDHTYERFAPMAPDGTADPAGGIVQFVVGTGGAPLRDFEEIHPQSEARTSEVHGVLRLDLRADGYDFAFIPVEAGVFTDSGGGSCH